MNEDALHELIAARLRKAESILVVSHIRPDGDAIGSALGFGLALRKSGKAVTIGLEDGVPANFRSLPGSQTIIKSIDPCAKYDLIVSVDASDYERLGEILAGKKVDIQIDHHITNVLYAEVNLIDPSAVSTSAMLAEYLPVWGFPIDQEAATALLTGIVTDSIGFRTSNTNPAALRLTAALMEKGADLASIYYENLVGRSLQQLKYWGFALQRLQKNADIAWTYLTLADREQAGYNGNDDADLNPLLSSISGCNLSVLFVEQAKNHVKVSWRSKPGFDVSQIAFQFGGGGHPAASGADIEGELSDVQDVVLQKTISQFQAKIEMEQK